MPFYLSNAIYTESLVQKHDNYVFVFGDNDKRVGKAGQAVIRDFSLNTFGFCTKIKPSMSEDSFYSDTPSYMFQILNQLQRLYEISKSRNVIIPFDFNKQVYNLGTGLANLDTKAPKIFEVMQNVLDSYTGYKRSEETLYKSLKILVCGGRTYNDKNRIYQVLDSFKFKATTIISGGAKGADSIAEEWANDNCIFTQIHMANWDKYGKSAGYKRNAAMLDIGRPDGVIAFPGGAGTKNMVMLAREAGVKTVVLEK